MEQIPHIKSGAFDKWFSIFPDMGLTELHISVIRNKEHKLSTRKIQMGLKHQKDSDVGLKH